MKKLNEDEIKKLGGLLCELLADLDKVVHDHSKKVAALYEADPIEMEKYLRPKFLVRTTAMKPGAFEDMYIKSL